MTVNTANIVSGPYVGNDVTSVFSYDFRIDDKTQIKVYEIDSGGVATILVLDTDYVVDTVGNDAGGTITRSSGPLPAGKKWLLRSDYKSTQSISFSSQGGFFPDVHEKGFDKLTFLLQQIQEEVDRCIKVDFTGDIEPSELVALLFAAEQNAILQADEASAIAEFIRSTLITTIDKFVTTEVQRVFPTTFTIAANSLNYSAFAGGVKMMTAFPCLSDGTATTLDTTYLNLNEDIEAGIDVSISNFSSDVLNEVTGIRADTKSEADRAKSEADRAKSEADRATQVVGLDTVEQAIAATINTSAVTATGSTTARTLADRFGELKNVKDFGVKGDGSDETVAIQSAIDAGYTYFPGGMYRWFGDIIIRNKAARIVGDSASPTSFFCNGNGFVCRDDNYLNGTLISAPEFRNFSMYRAGSDDVFAIAIDIRGASSLKIEKVNLNGFHGSISLKGCLNTDFKTIRIRDNGKLTSLTGTYSIKISNFERSDGNWAPNFTYIFDNINIACTNDTIQYGILLESIDVGMVSNSYIGGYSESCVCLQNVPGKEDLSISGVYFQNVYFDGIGKSVTERKGLVIDTDSTLKIRNISFDNCRWGQMNTVFRVKSSNCLGLNLRGQVFNIQRQSGYFEGISVLSLDIRGYQCNIEDISVASYKFKSCGSLDISIVVDNIQGASLINVDGVTENLNIKSAVATNHTLADIVSIPGTVNNITNTGTNIKFTPLLTIGGGSTGITYSQKQGHYCVINGVMIYSVFIWLTSKGTDVGEVGITLPLKAKINNYTVHDSAFCSGFIGSNVGIFSTIANGNDFATLAIPSGTSFTTVTNSNINNIAIVKINGSVQVA